MQRSVIHPTSLPFDELYGSFGADKEWRDGIFPVIIRQANNDELSQQHWVIFDGPVEPYWPKLLSTLLDESRLLLLPSGHVLAAKDEVKPHLLSWQCFWYCDPKLLAGAAHPICKIAAQLVVMRHSKMQCLCGDIDRGSTAQHCQYDTCTSDSFWGTLQVSIFIETDDLSHAAPSTISRTNLTYFNPGAVGWRFVWKSWLAAKTNTSVCDYLHSTAEQCVVLA